LEEHQSIPHLRAALEFLVLAGIMVPVLRRLRVNQVIGFLLAGMFVGPYGLGLWAVQLPALRFFLFPEVDSIRPLAELGVLFLMFMIGLELSIDRLRALKLWVFGAGTMQVVLSTFLIAFIAWMFGNQPETALVLGLVLSLSSTAVVMQLMTEQRTLYSPVGRASFSILMMQDLAVVPIFILLDLMAKGDVGSLLPSLSIVLLKSLGTIGIIYVLGRRIIRPLFRYFAGKNQPDVFMALTLLCSLGIAGITASVGLSLALGAFLAGLLIAETEFRHEVEVAIEPFKGLLMGLFFMTVGMQTDWRAIGQFPILLPAAVIGLFLLKGAVIAIVLRLFKLQWGHGIQAGLLLGQGGEFGFVVIGSALAMNLLGNQEGQFMMLVVSLSLFMTPFAAKAGLAAAQRLHRGEPETLGKSLEEITPGTPYVIIAGFGRVGQLLESVLKAQGIRYAALDNDLPTVMQQSAKGLPVYYGNASRTAIWEKLHVDKASAVILTMDQPISALQALKAIRGDYPSLPILARSRDEKHAALLSDAGADMVVPETLEAGLQIALQVLQHAGMDEEDAEDAVNTERENRLAATKLES
jgi:monovalent cation:H+ antiporter-2, CPA2 family